MRRHLQLFAEFFKISLFVIGGGYAIIAVADQAFAKKKWTDEGELLDELPVFQMLPGIIATHTAVYVGRKVAGLSGAVTSVIAVALPSVAIFTAVAMGYDALPLDNPHLLSAFVGLRSALTGIIAATVIRSWTRATKDAFFFLVLAASLAALFGGVPVWAVLVASMAAGLAWPLGTGPAAPGTDPAVPGTGPAASGTGPDGGAAKKTFRSAAWLPLLLFLKYGLLCFGGGFVLVPMYIEDFVGPAAAFLQVSAEEFSNLMALTQMTPGPIGVNGATYFGFRLAGVPGAVLASAALLLPGSALMYLVLSSIDRFRTNRAVRGILRGAKPASLALMLSALWAFLGLSVLADGAFHFAAAAFVLLSLVLTLRKALNPVLLIVLTALASLAVRAEEREVTIQEFSDEVRGRVVAKVAEALGGTNAATAEVSGVVTFVGSSGLFLQRDGDALKVATDATTRGPALRPGDVAAVSGFPTLMGGRIVLVAKSVEKVGEEPLPPPRPVTPDELVSDGGGAAGANWLRVTFEGRVLGPTENGFAVDVAGVPVNVVCANAPDFLSDAARTHPKLRLTGVLDQVLDSAVFLGRDGYVRGVKLHADGADVALVPDLAYYAAKRTRRFVFAAFAVSAALAALLLGFAVVAFRQRRRLFRSRTLADERKRMADDLHDTIEQHLVGAGMLVKLGRLKEAQDVLVRAKREIRDIVWGLKNDDMMRLSPAEMLRQLAHDENVKGICRVDTRLAGLPAQMDAARMRDLSLIVREAVGNAIKHGGAKKVALTADPDAGGGWLLRVANDGAPFDPATAPGAADGHFGLEGMRQRARRLGAELTFAVRDGWTVLSLRAEAPARSV